MNTHREPWGISYDGTTWWSLTGTKDLLCGFKLKEHALLDASLYRALYQFDPGSLEESLCKEKIDIWECVCVILHEWGLDL